MPAPLTSVAIANRALSKMGARPLTTMQESAPPGPAIALAYEALVGDLLSSYPWTFTKDTAPLVRLADEQPGADGMLSSGWRYAYALPVNRLTPPDKFLRNPRFEDDAVRRFQVIGEAVHCDEPALWALARFRVDEALWPAYFVSAVIACLMAEVCMTITGNATIFEKLDALAYGTPQEKRRGGKLGEARNIDARNSGGQKIGIDDLVDGWRA